MPTKREREYYQMGFKDGSLFTAKEIKEELSLGYMKPPERIEYGPQGGRLTYTDITKPKRKLSAWNKYVKANSKKPRFRYRNGKLNLKKMAVAFRKTNKRGGKR